MLLTLCSSLTFLKRDKEDKIYKWISDGNPIGLYLPRKKNDFDNILKNITKPDDMEVPTFEKIKTIVQKLLNKYYTEALDILKQHTFSCQPDLIICTINASIERMQSALKCLSDIKTRTQDKSQSKYINTNNRLLLEFFIQKKKIMVDSHVFIQSLTKINTSGDKMEKIRFKSLTKFITVVDTKTNERFAELNDSENIYVSTAENERAVLVTANRCLCNKLERHYPEMKYKLFNSTSLNYLKKAK